jgi:hypothetical protein
VIVGQDLAGTGLFLILDDVVSAEELAIVAHVLVQVLDGLGQDGRQESLQVVDDTQDHVHARRRRGSLVLLDLEPGRLAVQG